MEDHMKILDLGCGESRLNEMEKFPKLMRIVNSNKVDVIGVDYNSNVKPDIIADLNRGIPLEDNSVDIVYSNLFLEHIEEKNKLFILKEIWRVLKPRGRAFLSIIHGTRSAFDNEHKSTWFAGFFYSKWIQSHFKIKLVQLHWDHRHNSLVKSLNLVINSLANISPRFCERFWMHQVGGFDELNLELEAIKKH